MDDSGFPRTPDRPVKLLGTCVRYLRSVETSIGARGPDFLGGSATEYRKKKEHILFGVHRAKKYFPSITMARSLDVIAYFLPFLFCVELFLPFY